MTFTKELLNYGIANRFHEIFYEDLLTEEHIQNEGMMVRLDKLIEPNSEEEFNFWGWRLRKGNKIYLISIYDSNDTNIEIDLRDILPLKINSSRKVAHNQDVYHEVTNYSTAKFRPKKHYELSEVVKLLTSLPHSNVMHYKINMMRELASYMYSFCSRLATPPGFGKDSTTQLFNTLFGKFHVIEEPTKPKFYYEISICNKLVLTEISSWSSASWRLVEPTLLNSSDGKKEVQKSSRAGFGVGDTINISGLSIDLFYNDIDKYPDTKKYIDFRGNDAVPDRFIPFRFHGRITQNFSEWAALDSEKIARDNIEEYRKIIESIEYYKVNSSKMMHGYSRDKVSYPNKQSRSRWLTHLYYFLNVVDMCSNSQEQFDAWVIQINKCIFDYDEMLKYPDNLPMFYAKLGVPKTFHEGIQLNEMSKVIGHLRTKLKGKSELDGKVNNKIDYVQKVMDASTFIEKNVLLHSYKDEDSDIVINDGDVEW